MDDKCSVQLNSNVSLLNEILDHPSHIFNILKDYPFILYELANQFRSYNLICPTELNSRMCLINVAINYCQFEVNENILLIWMMVKTLLFKVLLCKYLLYNNKMPRYM